MKRTARAPAQPESNTIRCAIYTRKSTEEGLEQAFNSLDAQREAAEAYIQSQRGEGWEALPDRYDDGGFSGGNMERPAMARLLADIEAGRVNAVVVYKVVHVDGLAASIASLVAMAGNQTLVAENAMLMLHRPWSHVSGDAEEMRRHADALEKAWSAMLATYARRTGRRPATLAQRVTDAGGEWWMTAEEAVAEGFADGTEHAEKETQVFGLERFHRVPERLAAAAKDAVPVARPAHPRAAEIEPPRVLAAPRGEPRASLAEVRRRVLAVLRVTA